MGVLPIPLKAQVSDQVSDFGDGLDRSDLWLFGPLIAVLVAMPLAIVTILSVSLWFAAQRGNLDLATQQAPTTFANRWPDPNAPGLVLIR